MLRHPQALGSRRRFAAQGADTVPRALPGPGRPLFPAWHGEGSKFPPPSPMPGAASPPLFSRELFRAALGSRDAILRLPAPGQLYAAGEEQRRGLRWAEGGILRSLPRPARLCRRSRPAFCLRPLGSPCVCSMAAPGSLACWKRRPCSAVPSSGAGGQTPACLRLVVDSSRNVSVLGCGVCDKFHFHSSGSAFLFKVPNFRYLECAREFILPHRPPFRRSH